MVEMELSELEGERLRYNDDTWEFTGRLDARQNGSVLLADAKATERVRRNSATLRFVLQNPPASLNPGNLGTFEVDAERREGGQYLVVTRPHAVDNYRLENVNYD